MPSASREETTSHWLIAARQLCVSLKSLKRSALYRRATAVLMTLSAEVVCKVIQLA
jgi:hypothetical protein